MSGYAAVHACSNDNACDGLFCKKHFNAITTEMPLPVYYKLFNPLGPLPAYLQSPIQDHHAIFTANKCVCFFQIMINKLKELLAGGKSLDYL